jgi:hypothetical protein
MYVGWDLLEEAGVEGALYSTGVDNSVGWSRMNDGEVVQSLERGRPSGW